MRRHLKHWRDVSSWQIGICFLMTVVMILTDSEVLTSYIIFCEDTVTQTKQVTIHLNNKKWVTKDMKSCLVDKKKAFLQGDKVRMRELQKEFKRKAMFCCVSAFHRADCVCREHRRSGAGRSETDAGKNCNQICRSGRETHGAGLRILQHRICERLMAARMPVWCKPFALLF